MEDSDGEKRRRQREFSLAWVGELSSTPSSASSGIARLSGDTLQIQQDSRQIALSVNLPNVQVRFSNVLLSRCHKKQLQEF